MTRIESSERDGLRRDKETKRVEEVYAGYAANARKRRAWAAENLGNGAIRAELVSRAVEQAATALAGTRLVLDIGCGTGWWLEQLIELDVDPARVVGIDIQRARVEAVSARLPSIKVSQADARSFDITPGSCDLVTLFTVLSSLKHPSDVFAALARARAALHAEGLLMVYEPRIPNPLNPGTRYVSGRELDRAGLVPRTTTFLTVFPPIARRLGRRTALLYPKLRAAGLVSHRLVTYRASPTAPPRSALASRRD